MTRDDVVTVSPAGLTPPDPKAHLVVANVSGGKDSSALSLWLTEQGIEHRRVFSDTGWEHPATLKYVDSLEKVLGPIDRVQALLPMAALIRKKGMFPGRTQRWCTSELKVKPITAYMEKVDPEWRAIVAVGVRADESAARAKLTMWEHDGNAMERWTWRPLINWSVEDVFDIHKRHGLSLNPLYGMGAERVGCFPCIYARKAEIKLVADIMPERIDEIRQLEAEMHDHMEAKKAASEEYRARAEEKRYRSPTFFNANNAMTPIDEVVEWSRTSRGGRHFELFESDPDPGCLRWGICERPEKINP